MSLVKSCLLFAGGFSAVTATSQVANGNSPDKSSCNFFNPVPATLMRELSPDRPDKTESPYTVDAGHFQLEMDFANHTYDKTDGQTTKTWNIAPFNLKAGLFNHVDVQLGFDNYLHTRIEDRAAGTTSVQSGIGDFTTRLKINLWGNDGGQTAFALLPFIKFPVNTGGLGNKAVEGGLIFPLAVKLPCGFDMGLETAVSILEDSGGGDYHADFINSITISHDIVGRLGGYLEFFSDISAECSAGWVGTVDAGLTFSITQNVQLDCGCNFGVTRDADDFNPFAGLTWRF